MSNKTDDLAAQFAAAMGADADVAATMMPVAFRVCESIQAIAEAEHVKGSLAFEVLIGHVIATRDMIERGGFASGSFAPFEDIGKLAGALEDVIALSVWVFAVAAAKQAKQD